MKVKKLAEDIQNLEKVGATTTVINPVQADAKEFSKKAKKNFDKVAKPQDKAFTGAPKQKMAKEPEMAKINLEESLFEDYMNEAPDYDLRPVHDSRKSFYNKARVNIDDNGNQTLFSYNTPVAKIVNGEVKLMPRWNESQTTLRHVKEFLKQNGFEAGTLKDIAKKYPMSEAKKDEDEEDLWTRVYNELDAGQKAQDCVREVKGKRYASDMINTTYDGDIEVAVETEAKTKFAQRVAKHYGLECKVKENTRARNPKKKFIATIKVPADKKLTEAYVICDFSSYKPWSGAVNTYERIADEGLMDDFENLIDELYPEGINETELNDLLWFDDEWVYEQLGISDEKDVTVHCTNIQWDAEEDELEDLPEVQDIEITYNPNEDDAKDIAQEKLEDDYGYSVIDFEYTLDECLHEGVIGAAIGGALGAVGGGMAGSAVAHPVIGAVAGSALGGAVGSALGKDESLEEEDDLEEGGDGILNGNTINISANDNNVPFLGGSMGNKNEDLDTDECEDDEECEDKKECENCK